VYEEIHVVSEPHKIRSLIVCEEFPIGCSPHKDQVLSAWVIPPKTHESFIFHLFCYPQILGSRVSVGVYILGQNYVRTSKDLNQN
jgi:hypothetical protein